MTRLFERIQESFNQQNIMETMGARLVSVEKGACEIAFDRSDHLLQQAGFLHAGVSATVVDSACGYAALSVLPEGSDVLSIEFKVNNLRPAAGQRFLAKAEVLKAGRQIIVTEGFLYDQDTGKALMKMTCTIFPVYPK